MPGSKGSLNWYYASQRTARTLAFDVCLLSYVILSPPHRALFAPRSHIPPPVVAASSLPPPHCVTFIPRPCVPSLPTVHSLCTFSAPHRPFVIIALTS
jgi:hypothetical protein